MVSPGRRLAHDEVERVRRVERRAVDRGDDVTGLEAGLRGRAPATTDSWATGAPPCWPWASGAELGALAVRVDRPPWPLRRGALAEAAFAVGIQAPLSTGRSFACLIVGSMVSNRMPSHGRASGWPADAWASSGRAMLIGMAKLMPWLSPAPAVLMPMTLPLGSSSGPPLLPGLMAVSVWIRLWRTCRSRPGCCGRWPR